MSEQQHPLTERAEEIHQGIRGMCHESSGAVLPAPDLFQILGTLQAGAHLLPQALNQLADGLVRSLTEYVVTEDDGRTPTESVLTATRHLTRAGWLAGELGRELEAAQEAISGQGYSSKRPAQADGGEGAGHAKNKAWQAHAAEAIEYFQVHGGDAMNADERATYERLLRATQETVE